MPKSSVIEIVNGGPHTYREFELPESGSGVVVLTGPNESGKTVALNAVRKALGADVPFPVRDGQKEGSVTIGNTTVRVAKRTRRIGATPSELDIVHIEDQYDISKLVDPGRETDEAADAVRIKALLQLTGAAIDWQEFERLIPPNEEVAACSKCSAKLKKNEDTGEWVGCAEHPTSPIKLEHLYDDVTIEEARNLGDPVAIAGKVKRIFDSEALRLERLTEKEYLEKTKCEDQFKDVNLSAPSDREQLQKSLTDAVTAQATIRQRKAAYDRAEAARKEAEARLAEAGTSYAGPKVEDAETVRNTAQSHRDTCATNVADLEQLLTAARGKLELAEANLKTAESILAGARAHRRLLTQWDASLAAELPECPSPDDIAGADQEVADAEAAALLGVRIRAAADKKAQAAIHGENARRISQRAYQLRDAAAGVEELLSRAVKCDELAVRVKELENGKQSIRLYYVGDGRDEEYSRLSDGKRWKTAIKIAAERVHERGGDGTRMIVLPQAAWQDLQPKARDEMYWLAVEYGIVIVTAMCDDGGADGQLRAIIYQPTRQRAELLAAMAS